MKILNGSFCSFLILTADFESQDFYNNKPKL